MAKMDYEATVTLPTKGLLYKEVGIPSDVSLRSITTNEEKIIFASRGDKNTFSKVIKNCIVEPKNLDVNELISADENFLLLQLRIITYGNKYKVSAKCPICGATEEYIVDLSEFPVDYLDDNFEEPIIVDLPRSGDKLGLKILRKKDVDNVEKSAKKFAKQFNQKYSEVFYVFRMAKYIDTINGEKVDFTDAREYVENMAGLDNAKFWSVLDKTKIGVDTTITETCNSCGEEFDFDMPLTPEFFRPSIF